MIPRTTFNILLLLCTVCAAKVVLDNYGRLNNILISIADDVPFNLKLMKNLKIAFVIASHQLSVASRIKGLGGFQFGRVYILLPDSWNINEIIEYPEATWQSQNSAHFRVTTREIWKPQIHGMNLCGQPGLFVELSNKDLLDSDELTTFGKQLAYEFAHLRYGVFDEFYGPEGPQAYLENGIFWKPITCSNATNGGEFLDKDTGQPCFPGPDETLFDPNCLFQKSANSIQTDERSRMLSTYMDCVEAFLTPGNRSDDSELKRKLKLYVPNPHNKKCNGRSAQSVMLQHSDYRVVIEGSRNSGGGVSFTVLRPNPSSRRVI